jgi:hypothetical protein
MIPDWFFVIFAPGTAGNHLANLISTDTKFTPRASDNFYNNLINNAHTANDHVINNVVNQPLSGNTVTCCHLGNYLWHQTKINNITANKKYLVIEFPQHTRNPLFVRRLMQLYPYYSNEFLIEELSTFYSVNTISKLIDTDDITPITADKIFNKNCSELFEYLYNNFGFNLAQQAQDMHTNWIQMLERQ